MSQEQVDKLHQIPDSWFKPLTDEESQRGAEIYSPRRQNRIKANEWWNSLTPSQKEGAVLLLNNEKLNYSPDSAYWTGRTVTDLYNQLKEQLG